MRRGRSSGAFKLYRLGNRPDQSCLGCFVARFCSVTFGAAQTTRLEIAGLQKYCGNNPLILTVIREFADLFGKGFGHQFNLRLVFVGYKGAILSISDDENGDYAT